jgi:hypothetical protein
MVHSSLAYSAPRRVPEKSRLNWLQVGFWEVCRCWLSRFSPVDGQTGSNPKVRVADKPGTIAVEAQIKNASAATSRNGSGGSKSCIAMRLRGTHVRRPNLTAIA